MLYLSPQLNYAKLINDINYNNTMRRVVIYKGEDDYWIAECPTLPGCVSQGKTVEEALKNIQEAIKAYVEALKMDELPIPPETNSIMLAEV
jgi:predicted RNase H-like HicB family nuclease